MSQQAGLLGHFADLVIGTTEPQRLGERTLEVVMAQRAAAPADARSPLVTRSAVPTTSAGSSGCVRKERQRTNNSSIAALRSARFWVGSALIA